MYASTVLSMSYFSSLTSISILWLVSLVIDLTFRIAVSLFSSELDLEEALLLVRCVKAAEKLLIIEFGIFKFKIKHLSDVSGRDLHRRLSK